MQDADFRARQRSGLRESHVAPVNALVDELGRLGRGWAAHVAPIHGGVRARVLWVLRDPGPAVVDPENDGAGFLCVENDDPTAARLCALLERARIDVGDTVPWNSYPWYVNRAPSAAEVRAGVDPLRRLLALLPDLQVVLLLGRHAQRSWELLLQSDPAAAMGLDVLASRHPSRQAFIGPREQAAVWREEQAQVFERAGRVLG